MYHRYGRHGLHAWKRRRQLRFQQRLPAIASTVAIVRFRAPVPRERIIFIVVTSPDNSDDLMSLQREQSRSLQTASDNSPLANRARVQAVDDIDEIKALCEREGQVTILNDLVGRRARILASEEVKNNPPADNLGPEEYKHYKGRYQTAYLDQFEKERRANATELKSLPDEKATELARKARQDKEKYVFPSSGRGPFHQRDLAVVSALHILGLCQNLEEHLPSIHRYVDIYEEAFRNPQKEVFWPNPASF